MMNPPAVTAAQMREVDRAMVEDFHIELVQMVENAGRALAHLSLRRFVPRSAVVLAGSGGNGGGGLVAARHLANRGVPVHVVMSGPDDALSHETAHQLDIVRRLGILTPDQPSHADLVVDAVIGYSLQAIPSAGPPSSSSGPTTSPRQCCRWIRRAGWTYRADVRPRRAYEPARR